MDMEPGKEESPAESTWVALWDQACRSCGVMGNEIETRLLSVGDLGPRFSRHVYFVIFCEERCGADAADHVLVSAAVLDELGRYFGPEVDAGLARLTALAESHFFVSDQLFRDAASDATTRYHNYGYGSADTEFVGISFERDASLGGYALLQCTTGTGHVDKTAVRCGPDGSLSIAGKVFSSVAELAQAKLQNAFAPGERSRWANILPSRTQKLRLQHQVANVMSGYGCGYVYGSGYGQSDGYGGYGPVVQAIAKTEAPLPPSSGSPRFNTDAGTPRTLTVAELSSRLSGHSYCFLREVQQLFGSVDSIEVSPQTYPVLLLSVSRCLLMGVCFTVDQAPAVDSATGWHYSVRA